MRANADPVDNGYSNMESLLHDVVFTPLLRLEDERGEIRHGLRRDDEAFSEFGEAYFSAVSHNVVKGWKRHTRMHSNLIVVSGMVRFVLFDGRDSSPTKGRVDEFYCGPNQHGRLTVPPGLWMAFQGVDSAQPNLLLNIASIQHDPDEAVNTTIDDPAMPRVDWSLPAESQ
ncbi:MAG: dTDP-4-dehydrorhamnose 3,5-epimerase [Planctomycetota bacterium]